MKVVDSAVFPPEVLQENPFPCLYVLLEALAFLDLWQAPFLHLHSQGQWVTFFSPYTSLTHSSVSFFLS